MFYQRVCNKNNTPGVISGAGIAYPSGAHEFTYGFSKDGPTFMRSC